MSGWCCPICGATGVTVLINGLCTDCHHADDDQREARRGINIPPPRDTDQERVA